MPDYDTDVAVIGYGPSGVSAANALGRDGVRVVALERDKDIYPRARAVTVNDWTMRCLQSVGLASAALEDMDVTAALRWVTYDGTEIMRVDFPASTLGHAISYAIYQPLLEQTLREGAERYPSVEIRYGVEASSVVQDEDGVTVTTTDAATGRSSSLRARYALACDGGSSSTRRALGIRMDGDTVPVRWIVVDAKVKRWWPNRHILTFWSDRERPVVDIALGRGNHRWEFPLRPDESDNDYPTQADVWPLLHGLGITQDDVDIHQYAFYSHHIRMAEQWRAGRVLLVGDAAHLMPPWAGAGMQSGVRDAFNIAWKLREVLAGRLDPTVLDTYQAERQPNVAFFTEIAVMLGRIITQDLTPQEREALAPAGPPPLAMPPTYVTGWLSGLAAMDSAVGKMIPQPLAADPRGVIGPLDDLLGNGFVLLGDAVDPSTLLSPEQRQAWDRLAARYVAVRPADGATEGSDEIVDLDGTLLAWMRGFGAHAIAVRPDRFVAAADSSGLDVPS